MIPRSFWTLTCSAALSSFTAFYVISVRQARGLLSSSFRFHLAVDTLEVPLLPSRYGAASGLSPFRLRPCWAHQKENPGSCNYRGFRLFKMELPLQQFLPRHSIAYAFGRFKYSLSNEKLFLRDRYFYFISVDSL